MSLHELVPAAGDPVVAAIDLKAVLARITGAGDKIVAHGLHFIKVELVAGNAQDRLHDFLALRSLYGKLAITVAGIVNLNIETVCLAAYPLVILVDVGGIDGEQKVVIGKLADASVVDRAAVGITHHAVEHLARTDLRDIVGEDMVHEALGILAGNEHLAHVRDVEHATVMAHSVVLLYNRCVLDRHVKARKRSHQCP